MGDDSIASLDVGVRLRAFDSALIWSLSSLRLGGVDLLVELVVDHHDRRGAAAGEALDELDRDLAVRRDFAGVGVEILLERRAGLVAAHQRAGQRAADLDVPAADRLLPEHRVEGDHFVDVDRLQLELRPRSTRSPRRK